MDDESDPHVLFMRSGSEIVFVCMYNGCGKQFSRKDRLSVHQRMHTGDRPFKCEYEGCTKSYSRMNHLLRHQENTHIKQPEKEKVFYRCEAEDCSSIFTQYHNMQKHFRIQHGADVVRPYKCEVEGCGMAFRKQVELRTHTTIHTNIAPFTCTYPGCMRSFRSTTKLRRHSKVHDGYRCPVEGCGLVFSKWTEVRTHRSKAHLEEHSCEICGKTFHKRYLLNAHHRAIHADLVPVSCPYEGCSRRYWDKRNLKTHIKTFHNHQRFICTLPFCGKTFSSKQRLRSHIIQHGEGWSQLEEDKTNQEKPKPRSKPFQKRKNARNTIKELTGIQSMDVVPDLGPVEVKVQPRDQTESDEDFHLAGSGQEEAEWDSKGSRLTAEDEAADHAVDFSLSRKFIASLRKKQAGSGDLETTSHSVKQPDCTTSSTSESGSQKLVGSKKRKARSLRVVLKMRSPAYRAAMSMVDGKAILGTSGSLSDEEDRTVCDSETQDYKVTIPAVDEKTCCDDGTFTAANSSPTPEAPSVTVDHEDASLSPHHEPF